MIHLSLKEASKILKVSTATVKNWEKQGYLNSLNGLYLSKDVDDLRDKISRGEIDRLKSRANKVGSTNRFIPTEYIDLEDLDDLTDIIEFIVKYNIKPEQALFLLATNIFLNNKEFLDDDLNKILEFKDKSLFKRESLFHELKGWFSKISTKPINPHNKYCKFLIECKIPESTDILGLIYQSIIHEGKKSKLGSYYTPKNIVIDLLSNKSLNYSKVLDPCCGTGQFLLELATRVDDPQSIWGCDIDEIAVQIARINMFIFFRDKDIYPNIYNINSLISLNEEAFSLIATNPPWGAKIPRKDLSIIKKAYPEVKSKESFSFFLNLAIEKLVKGGHYLFVLPTSFLYVKNHSDIRSFLLNRSSIDRIVPYGRAFKKVFSSVITIEGVVDTFKDDISIGSNYEYNISQKRFMSNYNSIFNIDTLDEDQIIIDKVYSHQYTTLKDSSQWALGIVTGNNSKYLKDEFKEGLSPIYRGRDLNGLNLTSATKYIDFNRENFQQCAPDKYYFAPEKLIYKFISNRLSFSYDNNRSLTLNSANILIPEIKGYKTKTVGAILNSSLYNFIFTKLVNPLKILRGDLEILPFPKLDSSLMESLESHIEEFGSADSFLYELFSLDENQIKKVENLFTEKT